METKPFRIRIYETESGKKPFESWAKELRDSTALRRIQARLAGVIAGNLGDTKPVGSGVSELRLQFGPGYRIYFGRDGDELLLLLCGGDKSSQTKDIQLAKHYWLDYRRRQHEQEK